MNLIGAPNFLNLLPFYDLLLDSIYLRKRRETVLLESVHW